MTVSCIAVAMLFWTVCSYAREDVCSLRAQDPHSSSDVVWTVCSYAREDVCSLRAQDPHSGSDVVLDCVQLRT